MQKCEASWGTAYSSSKLRALSGGPARSAPRRRRDDHGRTPLHWAAFLGLTEVMGTLVRAAEEFRAEAACAAAASAAEGPAGTGRDSEEQGLPALWIMQVGDRYIMTGSHAFMYDDLMYACKLMLY